MTPGGGSNYACTQNIPETPIGGAPEGGRDTERWAITERWAGRSPKGGEVGKAGVAKRKTPEKRKARRIARV